MSAAERFIPAESALRRALRSAEDGVPLDALEAQTLLHARGEHLDRLVTVAGQVRDAGLSDAGRPGVITYSRKVSVPVTHLCRDRCHCCTFARTPGQLQKSDKDLFLSPDEILDITRHGAAMGCKEALFTLGDRPEDRWPAARKWLDAHGYDSTLDYVRTMAIKVLEETGLLPHIDPGVMSRDEIQRLKPVAPSMGMMLGATSNRRFSERGAPHCCPPDDDPSLRLRVLEDAGHSSVPFTAGILLGSGETYADRIDSLFAIRTAARRHGHMQEVIVQNVRAKDATAMSTSPDRATEEYTAAVAVTRLLMGPEARIQVPPDLADEHELDLLVRAGIDDWGGVSPLDHVDPERPWPQLDDLTRLTAESGYTLRERLTAYPHYVRAGDPWIDPRVQPHVRALAAPDGLALEEMKPTGLPWQESDQAGAMAGSDRVSLHTVIDPADGGRSPDARVPVSIGMRPA